MLAWLSPKTLALVLTIVNVCSLIPLLWIGFYNYASADDFGEASKSHLAWMATHNVFAAVGSGIWKSLQDWVDWMGYYTCNLFMAVSPITFGEKGYWIVALMMIIALSLSTLYLVYTLLVKVFQFDKYLSLSIGMIIVFVTIQCMPMAGRVEAFYWYSGAVNYIFVHSLANFFYGLLLSLACKDVLAKKKSRLRTRIIGTSVLGFFVAGGNQMTMLNVGIVLVIAISLITYHHKWKQCRQYIAPMICFFVGLVLNVAAPGNFVRSEISNGMGPIKAIMISLHYGLERCVSVWTSWPVLLAFITIGVLAFKMTEDAEFSFDCPLVVIVLSYGLTSAMMTPPLFAVGNMEAGRLQAITYVMYILLASLTVVYVAGWCRKQYDAICPICEKKGGDEENLDEKVFKVKNQFAAGERLVLATIMAFMLCGSALSIIPSPDYYTFTQALTELRDGSAKAYYQAHCERTEVLHSNQTGIIEVEAITIHPSLLFFSDINTEVLDWENNGLARYLGIEGVVVKK